MKRFLWFWAGGLLILASAGCAEKPAPAEKPVAKVEKQSATPPAPAPPLPEELPVVAPPAPVPKPAPPAVEPGQITEVDADEVLKLQDAGRILPIDVRPRLFYGIGHLPGAISVPKKSFELSFLQKKGEIDAAREAGKVLVLYCANASCPDGMAAGRLMAKDGYSVSIYKGGWEEWQLMGL